MLPFCLQPLGRQACVLIARRALGPLAWQSRLEPEGPPDRRFARELQSLALVSALLVRFCSAGLFLQETDFAGCPRSRAANLTPSLAQQARRAA